MYDEIVLTEEEIKAAILEGKKRKYFHEKHKDYWKNMDKGVTKTEEYLKPSQPDTPQKGYTLISA